MPKYVYVSLKGHKGHVDLTFKDTKAHRFQPLIKHLLESDMTVHQTGGAAAIRITSAVFEVAEGIAQGLPKVKAAFQASARLIEFYRRHRSELDQQAKAATEEQSGR